MEKFSNAEVYGFDAVELPGRYLQDYYQELLACRKKLPLPVSSISLGYRGSLLSKDENVRKQCRDDIKSLLDLCSVLGAIGLVMPPALFKDNHQCFTGSEGDKILLGQLPELAEYASGKTVHLMLEPVNSDETEYLTTLEHAVRLCESVNNPGLAITADWFHMHKEEMNMAIALRRCGKWLKHFHISESPGRTEPTPGGLDFKVAFDVLNEIGYKGYAVLECRCLTGLAETVLPTSLAYLKNLARRSL
ncbi:MAG: sugar phosphate isomerase/epimerase [Victivallales bacterium]|nr:sugar phosphate isomerase/epimerase [Victivallales bacterium]